MLVLKTAVVVVLLACVVMEVDARTGYKRRRRKCNEAVDCQDDDARTVCWSHNCHKNIPCNKNDDCYFYGAANVPKFRCFQVPGMPWPEGYGTCVQEHVGGRNFEPFPDYNSVKVKLWWKKK